jgi:pyruvyl transferase EpsO
MVQLTIGSHVVLLQLILNSLEKSGLLMTASIVALPVMLLSMAVAATTLPIWLLCTPLLFSLVVNLYILLQLAVAHHYYQPPWKMLAGVSLSGALAYVAIVLLGVAVPFESTQMLTAIGTFIGVLTLYFLLIWLSKIIDKSDIALIKSILFNVRRSKAGV